MSAKDERKMAQVAHAIGMLGRHFSGDRSPILAKMTDEVLPGVIEDAARREQKAAEKKAKKKGLISSVLGTAATVATGNPLIGAAVSTGASAAQGNKDALKPGNLATSFGSAYLSGGTIPGMHNSGIDSIAKNLGSKVGGVINKAPSNAPLGNGTSILSGANPMGGMTAGDIGISKGNIAGAKMGSRIMEAGKGALGNYMQGMSSINSGPSEMKGSLYGMSPERIGALHNESLQNHRYEQEQNYRGQQEQQRRVERGEDMQADESRFTRGLDAQVSSREDQQAFTANQNALANLISRGDLNRRYNLDVRGQDWQENPNNPDNIKNSQADSDREAQRQLSATEGMLRVAEDKLKSYSNRATEEERTTGVISEGTSNAIQSLNGEVERLRDDLNSRLQNQIVGQSSQPSNAGSQPIDVNFGSDGSASWGDFADRPAEEGVPINYTKVNNAPALNSIEPDINEKDFSLPDQAPINFSNVPGPRADRPSNFVTDVSKKWHTSGSPDTRAIDDFAQRNGLSATSPPKTIYNGNQPLDKSLANPTGGKSTAPSSGGNGVLGKVLGGVAGAATLGAIFKESNKGPAQRGPIQQKNMLERVKARFEAQKKIKEMSKSMQNPQFGAQQKQFLDRQISQYVSTGLLSPKEVEKLMYTANKNNPMARFR